MPSLIDLLKQQNFGPDDSMMASAAMHPLEALLKSKQWFDEQVNTGMGMPKQPTDEGDIYAQAPLDLARLLASTELAGLAEVGSFPSAPKSAGGTLGTLSKATKRYKDGLLDPSFRGSHGAPMNNDATAPLHELNKAYPDDIYSPQAAQYYGQGGNPWQDKQLFSQLQSFRGKPDEMVEIYRALPKDAPMEINHGDWVTTNLLYAKEHGQHALDGKYKIKKMKVPAKTLFTNADSPYEFGLDLSVLLEQSLKK